MFEKKYCITSDSDKYTLWWKDENGTKHYNMPKEEKYLENNTKFLEENGYTFDETWGENMQVRLENYTKLLYSPCDNEKVYTAEMAHKDYEENNPVVKATKHYVKFAEDMIKRKAKEGKNQWGFSFLNNSSMQSLFEKCIPDICHELVTRGFRVTVRPNRIREGHWISIRW